MTGGFFYALKPAKAGGNFLLASRAAFSYNCGTEPLNVIDYWFKK
jgi:hypothetical protein